MLAAEGYDGLVNMEGGFHGARDQGGRIVEPGWVACGFETTNQGNSERTWEVLQEK
jgi:hypothetical protein